MSPVTTGLVGIGLLLLLFLLRMPVGFAMGFVGVVGFAYLSDPGPALSLLAQDVFGQYSSYPLSVIPMFILMGTFAFASGISRRLYETAYAWVGEFRGGFFGVGEDFHVGEFEAGVLVFAEDPAHGLCRFCRHLRIHGSYSSHNGKNRVA